MEQDILYVVRECMHFIGIYLVMICVLIAIDFAIETAYVLFDDIEGLGNGKVD